MKKTDDDYFPPYRENPIKIEDDFEKNDEDFIKTTTELNKVDKGTAIEAKNKKKEGVLDAAADLSGSNDQANIIDIFGDLFENKALPREDEEFLNDLVAKIVETKIPQIILEVKYIPVKIEKPELKYDDVVMKKGA